MKRKQVISIAIDPDLLQSLDDMVAEREFRSLSAAVSALALGGIKLHRYRNLTKDPAKAAAFQRAMQIKIQEGTFLDWLASLQPGQVKGISDACNMVLEKFT